MPKPVYPAQADKMGITGSVTVLVLIDETGKPLMAWTETGPEILAVSAEDAAFKAR